jgi:hypothetical protein
LLALLRHTAQGYARAYVESKTHLLAFEGEIWQTLARAGKGATAPALSTEAELVLRDAYTEAKDFESEVILPEYLFLAILRYASFEALAYEEAKAFIQAKTARLQHQHAEINWTKQEALLQILRRLYAQYEAGKIALKPYLHQAYSQAREEIRGFALLVEEASKANKITIELAESTQREAALEQTLRFLAHRKYPLEEAFLYLYDVGEWLKVVVAPKEIFVAQENPHQSDLLGLDMRVLFAHEHL